MQTVKEAFQNPRNHEYPARSYLAEQINAASNSLFCVTRYDTYLFDDDPRDEDEYELAFAVCEQSWAEAAPFWTALGWDLTDDRGRELDCADEFKRQIIATVRELVPGARFCPTGDGVAAYDFDGQPIDVGARLGADLEDEARQFLAKRGKVIRPAET